MQYKNYEFGKEIKLIQELNEYKNSPIIVEFMSGTENAFKWAVTFQEIVRKDQYINIITNGNTLLRGTNPYPLQSKPIELFATKWRYGDFCQHKEKINITLQGYDKIFVPTKEEIKKYGMYSRLRDFVYSNTDGKIMNYNKLIF